MQKWKAKMAGLAILILAIAVIAAACSSGKSTSSSSPSSTPSSAPSSTPGETPQAEEPPIELTWLGFYPPDEDGSLVAKYMEERFNVKIKAMRVDRSNWSEQLNVLLAAKEIPDVFFLWNRTEINTYSKQGLLAKLPEDEIRQHMPKYIETLDAWNAPYLWNNANVDGANYAIPLYWPEGGTPNVPAYNGNWLKAVGYNEPPKTLEEFEDVLYKFRNEDPDGNGQRDTYGMSARGKDALDQAFRTVFAAYETDPFRWIDDKKNPGQITRGIITEETREALRFIKRLYDDGVINPEFITEDIAQSRQNFANGKVGYVDGGLWYHLLPEGGSWGQDFIEMNPDNEMVIGPQFSGPSGSSISWVGGLGNNFIGMGVQVENDERKKQKIYEILEALATDDEVYISAIYGIEGVSYDMVDGIPTPREEYRDVIQRGAKIGAGPFFGFFDGKSTPMMKYTRPLEQQEFRAKAIATAPRLEPHRQQFAVPIADEYPELRTLEREYFIKFIDGSVDLDKGFDDFIELWKRSGGQAIMDQTNEIANSLK